MPKATQLVTVGNQLPVLPDTGVLIVSTQGTQGIYLALICF